MKLRLAPGLFYLLADFFQAVLLPFLRSIKNTLEFLCQFLDVLHLIVAKVVQHCEVCLFKDTGILILDPSHTRNYLTIVKEC
jgi:hypothetical protein